MKRIIMSIPGLFLLLGGCQKKELPASPDAKLPSRQSMQRQIRKGMSVKEVQTLLGSNYSGVGGSVGANTELEANYRASDGSLFLLFHNDQLDTILSLPKANGTLNELKPKIQPGMSREKVWSILGYPTRASSAFPNGFVSGIYTYYLTDGALNIIFDQRVVKDIRAMPGAKNDIMQ